MFEATLGRLSDASSIRPTDMETRRGRPRVRSPRRRSPVVLVTEAETIDVPSVFISVGDLNGENKLSLEVLKRADEKYYLLEEESTMMAPPAPSFVASLIFSWKVQPPR